MNITEKTFDTLKMHTLKTAVQLYVNLIMEQSIKISDFQFSKKIIESSVYEYAKLFFPNGKCICFTSEYDDDGESPWVEVEYLLALEPNYKITGSKRINLNSFQRARFRIFGGIQDPDNIASFVDKIAPIQAAFDMTPTEREARDIEEQAPRERYHRYMEEVQAKRKRSPTPPPPPPQLPQPDAREAIFNSVSQPAVDAFIFQMRLAAAEIASHYPDSEFALPHNATPILRWALGQRIQQSTAWDHPLTSPLP